MTSPSLVCPYSNCGQTFEKPVMVTDCSGIVRETHYACPHCMLKLELALKDANASGSGAVDIRASEEDLLMSQLETSPKGAILNEGVSSPHASRPSKSCQHFLGYLRSQPESTDIPDGCAVCPSIVRCYVKKE